MAIKAGELIHVGNAVLLNRLQTAGPGNVNINTERINELGNYDAVAVVRDTPDLSFSMESLDVSAEVEALLTGNDFGADPAGTEYDLSLCRYLDVLSQFKRGRTDANPFDVIGSAVVPSLFMESMSYRFGLRDNASQSATLRGDSIYYAEGSAFAEEVAGTGTPSQVVALTHPAIPYEGDTVNGTRYAAGVMLVESQTRLFPGTDYTEADNAGTTEITILEATTETIRVVYQSADVASYPQISHAAASATRPAAVKGRDIEIRVGGNTVSDRWSGVQSVNVDWRATIERDEELGNQNVVAMDYSDVPEVSGTLDLKSRDFPELIARIKQQAGVSGTEVVGPLQYVSLPLDIIIHSPTDGSVVKTLYVPDAQFTLPGYSGQVQNKLTMSFPFESDTGSLSVFKGARA